MMPATFDQGSERTAERSDNDVTVDSSFPVGESGRLILENPRGSVRISGWDRPEIHVSATKRLDSSSARYESTRVELEQHQDTVVARTILDPAARFVERGSVPGIAADVLRAFGDLLQSTTKPAAVDYVVEVPRRCDLEVKGVSAEIAARNATGAIRIHTVSGSLQVADLAGELSLGTVSGAIRADQLAGRAQVESVSGEIQIRGDFTAIRVKTVSGDVEVAGPLAATGDYEFRSVSGGVTLHVPGDTRATVSLKGVSPDVSTDLPCRLTRDERRPGSREWQGQVNGGGAMVSFHTVSGHLGLRALATEAAVASRHDQTPASPSEAAEPAPSDPSRDAAESDAAPAQADRPTAMPEPPVDERESAQLRILQAVERGEVTVDEALRQIEALRGRQL